MLGLHAPRNCGRNDNKLVLSGGENGEWTPHDLRRTGATLMQALGEMPDFSRPSSPSGGGAGHLVDTNHRIIIRFIRGLRTCPPSAPHSATRR